jgi:hypothetical protein
VTTSTPATTIAISMQDARREVLRLPQQQQVDLFSLVQQSVHQRNKRCQDPLQLLASLQAKWGERMQPILKQLATLYGTSEQVKRLLASTVVEPVNGESPNSPLELDAVMLQHGEPSSRCKASSTATLELDDLGFVKAVTGPVGVDKVRRGQHTARFLLLYWCWCLTAAEVCQGTACCQCAWASRHSVALWLTILGRQTDLAQPLACP